ncbi:hypothetical protein [Chitinophaga sp. CB10]|uniref:hypothetical protein n=1 Tax=Chitinophaga sp. CB10 TaxID=1891659 RepID=UPI0025C18FA4|nr:hypothetical protein [Chitinophaga sp. CB10]
MKEIGATISKNGGSASQVVDLRQKAASLGRALGNNDAMVLSGAINNNEAVLTVLSQFHPHINSYQKTYNTLYVFIGSLLTGRVQSYSSDTATRFIIVNHPEYYKEKGIIFYRDYGVVILMHDLQYR